MIPMIPSAGEIPVRTRCRPSWKVFAEENIWTPAYKEARRLTSGMPMWCELGDAVIERMDEPPWAGLWGL